MSLDRCTLVLGILALLAKPLCAQEPAKDANGDPLPAGAIGRLLAPEC
jgi:hypothetical protein